MGERVHADDCGWIICCCGCLPILGIIKGIIIVGPIFIICLFSFTGISLILLLHDLFLTYKALVKTSIIGINLKILLMLLVPIAIFSWPVIVLVGSILFGFFYGLFCPTFRTFDSNYNVWCGGIIDVFKDVFDFIQKFWDFNVHTYFDYLREKETRKVKKPFDIKIIQIFIALFLAAYGTTLGILFCTIIWFIKLLPSIGKMYYLLYDCARLYNCLEILMFSILIIIAIALIPGVGVLTLVAYIGYAFYGGIVCAIEGYQNHIGRGLIHIVNIIRDCDIYTNEYIFHKEYSCLPDWNEKCLKKYEADDNESINKKENVPPKQPPLLVESYDNADKEKLIVNEKKELESEP